MGGVGLLMLVMLVSIVSWLNLPRWAPDWVIEHSPFFDPVVRAFANTRQPLDGTPESEDGFPLPSCSVDARWERISRWSADEIPFLEHCLSNRDRAIRLEALHLLWGHGRPQGALMEVLLRDPDPWVRLGAWNALCAWTDQDAATSGLALATTISCAIRLLDDSDGYIRQSAERYLTDRYALPWPVRRDLYSCLRQTPIRRLLVPFLTRLFEYDRNAEPAKPLPSDLLFVLLSLAQIEDGDSDLRELVEAQLPYVEQDFDALLIQLTSMQRGALPWQPGAEPWMTERLRLLTEQRISLSLKDAEMVEVVAKHFATYHVLIDPRVICSAPKLVTLDLTDVRVLDAVLALAETTGTKMHLSCDAVHLLYADDADGFSGFALPQPRIRIAEDADVTKDPLKSWLNELQRRYSTAAGDPPIIQILAELSRQSGIPITVDGGVIEPDWSGSHLPQVSLDHLLRLIAWYYGIQVELGSTGIRFFRLSPDEATRP